MEFQKKRNLIKSSILLLFMHFGLSHVNAQKLHPLSAQFLSYQLLTGNTYQLKCNMVLYETDSIPDHLSFWTSGILEVLTMPLVSKSQNFDSTITATYDTVVNYALGRNFWFHNDGLFVYSGRNVKTDENYSFNGHSNDALAGTIPELLDGIIHVYPGETVTGSLYAHKGLNTIMYDPPLFNSFRVPHSLKPFQYFAISDTNFVLGKQTGVFLWKTPEINGLYQFSPEIGYSDGHYFSQPIISFKVDSQVKSRFLVEPSFLDSLGLPYLNINQPGQFKFNFKFIDPNSTKSNMDWYTTLFNPSGTDKDFPKISTIRIGDTTVVDFTLDLSESAFQYLPACYNFVFKSFANDRKAQNRIFSFYVINPDAISNINEVIKENKCTVYPNPCADFIYIKDAPSKIDVTILDITGRAISKHNTLPIEVQNLNKGVYILKLVTDQGSAISRFVKE